MQQHYHSQPVVMVAQPPPVDNKFKPRSASALFGLSITQIIMGVCCVVFGTVMIPVAEEGGSNLAFIGYGVWIGAMFIIIGIVGAKAAKTNKTSLITAALVLNIIFPATGCIMLTSFTSVGLILTAQGTCHDEYYTYRVWEEPGYYYNDETGRQEYSSSGFYKTETAYEYVCDQYEMSDLFYTLDSLMLLMALVEFVITIISSAICCGALCRCCKQQVGTTVQYFARPQQMFVQPVSYPSVPNSYGYAFNPSASVHQAAFYPGVPVNPGWVVNQPPQLFTQQPAPLCNTLVPEQQSMPQQLPVQTPQQQTVLQPQAATAPPPEIPSTPAAPQLEYVPNLPQTQQRNNALPPISSTPLTSQPLHDPPSYSSLRR